MFLLCDVGGCDDKTLPPKTARSRDECYRSPLDFFRERSKNIFHRLSEPNMIAIHEGIVCIAAGFWMRMGDVARDIADILQCADRDCGDEAFPPKTASSRDGCYRSVLDCVRERSKTYFAVDPSLLQL